MKKIILSFLTSLSICSVVSAQSIDDGKKFLYYPGNVHAILTLVAQADRGKIGDAIRRDVRVGIAHLIHQLFGDRSRVDDAPRSGMLGDGERSVGADFGNREADVGEIGDVAPVLEEVPAGTLRTAFENVPGDRTGGDPVPVVKCPAELVDQRTQRQPGVGDAPGDDDVGALL